VVPAGLAAQALLVAQDMQDHSDTQAVLALQEVRDLLARLDLQEARVFREQDLLVVLADLVSKAVPDL
jgi:hypothetical protein